MHQWKKDRSDQLKKYFFVCKACPVGYIVDGTLHFIFVIARSDDEVNTTIVSRDLCVQEVSSLQCFLQ